MRQNQLQKSTQESNANLESVQKIEEKLADSQGLTLETEKATDKKILSSDELEKKKLALLDKIKSEPELANHYHDLGLIYLQTKNYEAACQQFQKSIELDSKLASAYANLGRAQFQLGKKTEGESSLNQAVELDPDEPTFCKDLSKIKFLKAKEFKKESLNLELEKQKSLLKKAEHEIRMALKFCVKLRYFDELLSLCYKKGSFVDIVDAIKQESELNIQRAKSVLTFAQEALKNKLKNPVSAIVQAYDLLVLTYVLEKQDKLEEALKFLKQAKSLLPEEPIFFYAESMLQQNFHKKSESIAALEQAKVLVTYYQPPA